jgi:glycosyltransferase involved in cell wall biosynthesis
MRIRIDATPLLLQSAGVKSYVYYWIAHLRRIAGEEAITTFPFASRIGSLDHRHSVTGRWATLAGLGLVHLANCTGSPLPRWIGRGVDVFHASHILRRPPRHCRFTITIYDMTCWLLPETHPPARVAAAKRFADRMIRRADGLIAISESARADAVRILGLSRERIEVIHPGVPEAFFEVSKAAIAEVRAKYGLAGAYILFVGTVEPRKNLPVLLDAYLGLPNELRREYPLVVAGPPGWVERGLLARLRAAGGGVHYLAYVPEADLPGLTAGASLFVYPSLYEGFGFPVAQAMAAGVPVVTSNVSSLPEITGGAAGLIDPRSVLEARAALERLLLAPAERAELARKGAEVARRYRWETCARKSLSFFERVAGGGL